MGGLHIDEKIVGLSISQWLPCPLAIRNLLFGMATLLNRVKPICHLEFLVWFALLFNIVNSIVCLTCVFLMQVMHAYTNTEQTTNIILSLELWPKSGMSPFARPSVSYHALQFWFLVPLTSGDLGAIGSSSLFHV